MEATAGTRLKQWREFKGLTLKQMFELTGVRVTTLSTAEQPGSTSPSYDTITKVLTAFPDLNPDWLLLGSGSMLRDGKELSLAPKPTPASPLQAVSETDEVIHLKGQIEAKDRQIEWLQEVVDRLMQAPATRQTGGQFSGDELAAEYTNRFVVEGLGRKAAATATVLASAEQVRMVGNRLYYTNEETGQLECLHIAGATPLITGPCMEVAA